MSAGWRWARCSSTTSRARPAARHRMLEIGCGNLRAGWRFIELPGRRQLLRHRHLARHPASPRSRPWPTYGLQDKLPHLTPVRDLKLEFLPDAHFDVVHAHSVFSHSPLAVIEECLAHVGRVLAPGGWFDFTFDRTEGANTRCCARTSTTAPRPCWSWPAKHGLAARFMDDWEELPHGQSKIRISHRPNPSGVAPPARHYDFVRRPTSVCHRRGPDPWRVVSAGCRWPPVASG